MAGTWRSPAAVAFATLAWVCWFNTVRRIARTRGVRPLTRLEPIGKAPPALAERRSLAQRQGAAMSAAPRRTKSPPANTACHTGALSR